MRMNFGKKDEIGEIDFGKIRSGIKKDDIAKDNEALKSIFSKFDKNADGVLSSDEIDSIEETLKQAMGDDDNLSTREAKTLFDSKNRKEDAKNLFLFLKNLASTTVGIKSVSNPVNKEGIKEEVVYEDGRKEILYEDGSKVIETQIAEKSVVSKFDSKGKLVQVVETDNEGTVKTTDFDENGNLKKQQTVKNNGNYIETTKNINGRTLTTIENKELDLVQEYVEGELVKETRGKTVIQYHGSSRTETTTDGDWKQVDNYEGDVLKSKIVSNRTDDGKSRVVTTIYNNEDSVVDTRIDDKRVSQSKVINGVTYSINYDGEGNTKIIVQNGESIATLAKKFGCTVEEIISANPDKVKGRGANAYFLVGEEIKIPRELEADLPALQNRKSAEGAQADYKAYDDAIKVEQARQAEQVAAAKADAERAEEKQQREVEKARARELAQGFYDIADHNHGVKSMDKMLEFLKSNINSSNIVDFLNAYTDPEIRKKDSSIIDTITSEIGPGINKTGRQKAVLYQLINTLCNAARKAGVAEDTIKSLLEAFVSSMNEELDNGAKRTDPTKMEIALDSLLGQIMAAKSGVKATSEDEAMQTVAGDFKETNDKATEDYDTAREEDSWIAKAGDTICGWFGCNTREEMRAKLGDNAKKVDALIEAANNGDKAEFKRIYKELFGVEFDPNLIAASEKANEDYMNAIFAKSQVEKMNTALSQINDSMSFEEIANVIKNLYSNDSEINADEVINEIIKMYTDAGCSASTEEDKKSILLDFVNSTKEANQKVLDELTANKTLEELQREAEIIGKSAFGTNDISKMVDEFNQNMVMTDAIGTAAVEIGATVLLQFVPGLGQIAAARLAVSAAKWGVKGAKIAKYAAKAGKFFKVASKLQSGTASASKVVNGVTRVATQAVAAGVATAGVGASKNEELEVIKDRIKQNMLFAGAGATSNILAPKLMQMFGVTRQVAVELAEELINAAAAYGITTINGDSYGTQDAFLDIAAGLIMARLAGGASARHAINGAKADINAPKSGAVFTHPVETPKPDVDVQPVRPEPPKAEAQAKTAGTDALAGKTETPNAGTPKTENVTSEKINKSETKSDVEPKTEAGSETKAERKAERKVQADKLKDLRTKLGHKLARAYVKIENAIKNMKNAVDFDKISTTIRTKFANYKTVMNELLDKLNAKMHTLKQTVKKFFNDTYIDEKVINTMENVAKQYNAKVLDISSGSQVFKNGESFVLDIDSYQNTQLCLGGIVTIDLNESKLYSKLKNLKEGESLIIGSWEGQGHYKIGSNQNGVSRAHMKVTKKDGVLIFEDTSSYGTVASKNVAKPISVADVKSMFKDGKCINSYYLDQVHPNLELTDKDYRNIAKLMNKSDGKYRKLWEDVCLLDHGRNIDKLAAFAVLIKEHGTLDFYLNLDDRTWSVIVDNICQKSNTSVDALYSYKMNSNHINKALSAHYAYDPKIQTYIDNMTKYLNTQTINKRITVFRGEQYSGSLGLVTLPNGMNMGKALENLIISGASEKEIQKFVNKYLVGTAVKQERFMSTALSEDFCANWASSGAMSSGGKNPNGAVLWEIDVPNGTRGCFAEDFNKFYKEEYEIILQRGSSLVIKGATFDKKRGLWIIKAKVVQPPMKQLPKI